MFWKFARILAASLIFGVVFCAPASAQSASDAATIRAAESSHSWKFSMGGLWRRIGGASFRQGTPQGIGSLVGGTSFTGLPAGIYDNGFVLPDLNGGPTTSNFGWDATTVVTPGGNVEAPFTFVLHKAIAATQSTFAPGTPPDGSANFMNGGGFFVKLQSPEVWRRGGAAISIDFAYSWTGMSLSRLRSQFAGILRQSTLTVNDTYGGPDFGVVPGTAYTGSPAGGPEIPLAPSASSQVEVRRAIIVDSEYNRTFGLDLHTLSVGPQLVYQSPDGRYQFAIGTGVALNFAFWHATSTEVLRQRGGPALQSLSQRDSGFRILPGFYVEAGAMARISETWFAMASARYDWAGEIHDSAGLTEFSLDLNGWTFMSGFMHTF